MNKKLRLISNGLPTNYKKFFPIQEKIYNNILTPKVNLNIEKFDKELADFVYNKKESSNSLSNDIKHSLCRYEIYNKLVGEQFRAFIIKNNKLKFNDPSQIGDNLKKIRTYLNLNDKDISKNNKEDSLFLNKKEKMQKSRNSLRNKLKFSKTLTNFSEDFKAPIICKDYNSINTHRNKNRIKNIKTADNQLNNNIYNDENGNKANNGKGNNYRNKLKSKTLNIFKNKNELNTFNIKTHHNNSKIKLFKTIDNNSRNNHKNKNKSKKFHSYDLKLENDFEKNYLDKYLTTKNYQQSYFKYESMMKKELKFQKYFLNIKNYNSKLYFDDYKNQIKSIQDNINERNYESKEKAFKEFTIIKNKVYDEIFGNKADLQKILNDHKKKITKITKGFKLIGKSAVDDEKMKNCMNKVIQRYIIENRTKKMGKFKNFVDNEEIKKKNEKLILKLNNAIKNISYKFYKKQIQFKNSD